MYRKYKEIALFVHPDRNRSQSKESKYMNKSEPTNFECSIGAEEAFKKVGEAYECLVDETSQMLYLNSIIKSNKNDGSFVKKKVPSSVKRKRSDYNEETTFKSKKSFVRRMRTPKEIWEAFQREEEEMARENFHEKGFDRIFNDDLETTGNNMDKSPILDEATKSKVLESNLDKKATEWMRWSSSCSSSSTREFEELEQKNACCLLCRRRFRSVEHLERHEMLSEMHKANVSAKQKAVQSPNTSNR
jgi:curved DNA-binding protein CbpA